jgi:hypothetical protein
MAPGRWHLRGRVHDRRWRCVVDLDPEKRDACDLFALGVSFGFMASIFAYLSQYQNLRIMKEGGDMPIGVRWERTAGIVSVNLGLVVFLIATVVAIVGFLTGQPGPAPLT